MSIYSEDGPAVNAEVDPIEIALPAFLPRRLAQAASNKPQRCISAEVWGTVRARIALERECLPLCKPAPNSNTGDSGYAGQDGITYDSTCTCGAPHGPSRPLRGGRIIRKSDAPSALDSRMSRCHPSASQKLSDDHADCAGEYKFNPLVLAEIQTGADSFKFHVADFRAEMLLLTSLSVAPTSPCSCITGRTKGFRTTTKNSPK